ncbi:FtsK/SpoIIIE domain-containing protein [Nocardioides bruguierae]|uniref:FtsK/SpoIIIE domain-containing protein n=1 Tax=Nocardioides bruguierae TaxID=2945102 RepID=A0A9X2IFP0_9ACTN|nr:FtsK/SpoIIIE domain-containing protein [Nocardioides bruguierae]MCM0621263.1 FtsK/SpoIIIE domain-containing protein [Nocardioides bruguierae]
MRLSVSVVDGSTRTRRDVLLDAEPDTAVADVLPVLLRATGSEVHPEFARRASLWVDGARAGAEDTLRTAGVRPGSVLALHETDGWDVLLPRGVVELRVVAGPGAGRVHRLGLGDHAVGNGAEGMSLPDLLLPPDALTVRVSPDATLSVLTCDPALRAGARLDGAPLAAAEDDGSDEPDVRPDVRPDGQDPEEGDAEVGDDQGLSPAVLEALPDSALSRRERRRRDALRERARAAAVREPRPEDPLPWPAGADLRLGGTVLQWHPVWQPDADATPSPDRLGTDFNRPPRLRRPVRERSFVLPAAPRPPRRVSLPWQMVLAPAVMAAPMALLFGSPRYLVLAALSPVMALFNWVAQRRGSVRDHREAVVAFRRDLSSVLGRLATQVRRERDDRREDLPDPAAVLLAAAGPGRLLWRRRREDDDALLLRLGVADLPSTIEVRDRSRSDHEEEREPDVLGDAPVGVSLRQVPVVGVCGDPAEADALARWLVGQAAVLHTPRDLRVVVLTGAEREPQWGWTRWLPHCRAEGEPVAALLGTDQSSVGRRVAELVQLVEDRRGDDSPGSVARRAQGGVPPGPDVLVVLDGARALRSLPGVVTLLREGPAVGVHTLCLDEDERSLPEECGAVLEVLDGALELRRTTAGAVSRIRPDLVEPAWAERVGRALAPVRDTTPDQAASTLPSSARLLELVGMPEPTDRAVAAGWGPHARTEVVLGAGFDGPFRLDLRTDGPHALVAGTTGSGKSELLQTLVASLALANSPEQMTFVLVDYKGGSAFKDCARLPHTVGMVTDLDTHLVGRALTSLGAELRRREHLLAGPGAKDLEDYWALQARDPSLPVLPRLAIVIDEFASLKSELPDFVDGLVTIAQRGRSLGIHLVLATQRPTGVVSNDIRANTNLRISLRMTDEAESRDVIDASDAATIGADQPGRGYARLGHSSLLPFQAGRVGGARPDAAADAARAGVEPTAWSVDWRRVGDTAPQRPAAGGPSTDEGETDLSVLVDAARGAGALREIAAPHAPWLPALPGLVLADDLAADDLAADDLAAAAAPAATGADRSTGLGTPWLLEDHPATQQQAARSFTLGGSGHLAVVGGPRSGRSTALRTIATGLARAGSSRDVHLYGLDCGNGALLPLTALPHTGAVVQRTETERAGRLLDRLVEEVRARQDLLGRSGFADVDEQRRAAAPEDRLPYLVLLLDRWEGFTADLGEIDLGRLNDAVLQLLREGASVGVQLVLTGDRSLLTGRISTTIEQKLLLRLPDRGDYGQGGLKVKDLPDEIGEGRGFWAEHGTEAQVAVLTQDASGAAQSEAVRTLGAALSTAEADLPPAPAHQRPVGLAALPAQLALGDVLGDTGNAPALPPGHVALAVGGDRLALLGVEAVTSPALVVGQPRSGRTTALCLAAEHARRTGRRAWALTPTANELTALLGEDAVVAAGAAPEDVIGHLRGLPDGSVLLVDDAETLREGPLAGMLQAVVRQSRERDFRVVVAGGHEIGAGFSGWLVEARKGRKGLLLSPRETGHGDLFGLRVPRTSLQARLTPGRGLLLDGDGDVVPVQVPRG